MKGCRPLKADEIKKAENAIRGRFSLRNKALFSLGLMSGFRIAELLSLKIKDVWQHGGLVPEVYVQRDNMKGKIEGRKVPLHPDAKPDLRRWIQYLKQCDDLDPNYYLFHPQSKPMFALSYKQAWEILTTAFRRACLPGKIGTHGMRKTFAFKMYPLVNYNLKAMQELLGHKSITSTAAYLGLNQKMTSEAWRRFSKYEDFE